MCIYFKIEYNSPSVNYNSDEDEEGEAKGEEEDREQARRGFVPPYCTQLEYQYFSI